MAKDVIQRNVNKFESERKRNKCNVKRYRDLRTEVIPKNWLSGRRARVGHGMP